MPKACEFNWVVNFEQLAEALIQLKNFPIYGDLLEKLIKFAAQESNEIFDHDEIYEQARKSSRMSWIDWLKLSYLPS